MFDAVFHLSWKETNSCMREQERERQTDLISGAQTIVLLIFFFSSLLHSIRATMNIRETE
jgi:hypothetical protein